MPITLAKIMATAAAMTPAEEAELSRQGRERIVELAQGIRMADALWEEGRRAIQDIGGDPAHKQWAHVPYVELFKLAKVARGQRSIYGLAAYGLTVTIKPPKGKTGPKTKKMTEDEMMEIKWKFDELKHAQSRKSRARAKLAALMGETHYSVTLALQWCEDHPSNYVQFRAKKLGQ